MKSVLFTFASLFLFSSKQMAQTTISGFSDAAAKQQLLLEQQFDQHLNAGNIGNTIQILSSKPHHLGSPGGKAVADTILNRFKSYGWDAHIETYYVIFPTPKTRVLEMTAPATYKAVLKEPALPEDATSNQAGQLPTYNAWSADGDVTGELVFVNYGLPDDYDMLERMGVSVKGKIVIAKYGHSWRGIKPKVAQEHGAIGCIIYSDPGDDGYSAGEVYPKGAYKNEYGVQRGSIMDMPVYPGDPLTPNYASTKEAKRKYTYQESPTIMKIPVLPVSYHDAAPLLKSLGGAVAPRQWVGGLPFTYHVGDGTTKVHLNLAFNWETVPCYNVIATLKGSQYPDEWIVRGNHHDAWVNGAGDPISGMSVVLEEAKAIGELVKGGWQPKRTLVYCAWDGEEPSLMGSTEWVEDHAKELQKKAVVYINSDGNGRGFLGVGGSQALQAQVNEVAKLVTDPQTGVSVKERWLAKEVTDASTVKAKQEAMAKKIMELEPLGSGSDFSPFLQHIGVASLNVGFGGEDGGGEYHSIYDSYDDYRRFKDPSFAYGVALAKTAGRLSLRMAQAEKLPFDYSVLYKDIREYTHQVMNLVNDMREKTKVENTMIESGLYRLANDTADHLKIPVKKDAVPYLNFTVLQAAVDSLQLAADSLQQRMQNTEAESVSPKTNELLYMAEQHLLLPDGLPRREWYKHAIYAPGFYTGYGVKTLPGIREAIEQRNWREAQSQIEAAASVINHFSGYLSAINP